MVVARTRSEELAESTDADVITGLEIDESIFDRADDLQLFAGLAAGYDHPPLDRLEAQGVTATNASGVHTLRTWLNRFSETYSCSRDASTRGGVGDRRPTGTIIVRAS
ncbi:hypothetical protein [Halarchaeum salinum]|uniref:Uncharacterized protein n=1 Tax=Halarchaeum salinum TaxID=489912 RepID=A0AAV3SBW8_9EURY